MPVAQPSQHQLHTSALRQTALAGMSTSSTTTPNNFSPLQTNLRSTNGASNLDPASHSNDLHQQLSARRNPSKISISEAQLPAEPQMAETDQENREFKLVPQEINLLLKENRKTHRTANYDAHQLVLRRGQAFRITVRFDKPYDQNTHSLALQFTLGSRSLISKGTHIKIPVGETAIVAGWKANMLEQPSCDDPKVIQLEVTTTPDCLIGRYKMYLETKTESEKSCLFRYADDISIIFNPFCKDDACYMENETHIQEYVMNEEGIIYVGSDSQVVSKHWYFGQFEFPCLEISLWLLERANLPQESRGDPMQVCRALAAMINGGDRGMLASTKAATGSGLPSLQQPQQQQQQPGGFQPDDWAGSVKIVKKFMEQRGQPVRYGASWTFSAVLCTMSRALGIPCRVVTGFNTGHDCDLSSTIDVHWDKSYRPIVQLNRDVIRVFHSWNEMWFKRMDINPEMNGWQAVDSTSHSASESLYRLGPCPVKCIESGQLSILHDTMYIAAMTNGYIVHWMVGSSGEMVPIAIEEDVLGSRIVTKSVQNDSPVDIKSTYKCPATSNFSWPTTAGRKANLIAACKDTLKSEDITADIIMPREATLGDTILFTWNVRNESDEQRTCEFFMSAYFANNDGAIVGECKELRSETMVLIGKEEKQHNMKIRAEDYMDRIKSTHVFKVFMQMHVVETDQLKPLLKTVSFDSYDMLKLIVDRTASTDMNTPFMLKVQIANPLKRVMPNCTLHMEGVGLPRTIILERPIRPLETTVYQTQITPTRSGKRRLFVSFSSALLTNIQKTIILDVPYPVEDIDEADQLGQKPADDNPEQFKKADAPSASSPAVDSKKDGK